MKVASRIASAALALAAIVSMSIAQPAQPAQAASAPDVLVEPSDPAYQVFGNVLSGGPGVPPDMNAYARSYFWVQNNGGGTSGPILVAPTCNYRNMSKELKTYAAKPAYVIDSLSSGERTLIWFDCKRRSGGETMPVSATLKARGNNEAPHLLKNNEATTSFQYVHP